MAEQQLILGNVPAPGEPLKSSVDATNQRIVDDDLKFRADALRARLSKREEARLTRRYDHIHRILNKRGYNRLCLKRAETFEEYQRVAEAYKKRPTPELKAKGLALVAGGKKLNEQIEKSAALVAEFREIIDKLEQHQRVLDFEREDAENRAQFYAEADVWEEQIKAVFRRSPNLRHVKKDANGKERIQIPIIERVLLQEDKVYFIIMGSHQNVIQKWFKLWDYMLPDGVNRSDLISQDTLDNLSLACGRIVTAEINKRTQNVMYVVSRLDSADGIPNLVPYNKVRELYPRDRHFDTPWPAGVTNDRKVLFFDFATYPHMLLAGSSGGGKTNLLHQLICTLITWNSPNEVQLCLIDNKRIDLTAYRDIPHLILPIVTTPEDTVATLIKMREIMEQRFEAFAKLDGINNSFSAYNANVKEKLPRIVIVLDEMATLIGRGNLTKEFHTHFTVLASQARAVGIHIVGSTQYATIEVLPNLIKTNLDLRVSTRTPTEETSRVTIGSGTAATLPHIPGRVVYNRGSFETIAQTPYISPDEIARAVAFAKNSYAPLTPPPPDESPETATPAAPAPIEVKPKFSRDDFINLAIDEFGGKLTPTVMHERIGGNEVITLRRLRTMKDKIIEQIEASGGVLTHRGIEYTLKKDRNAYRLQATETPSEPETEQESLDIPESDKTLDYESEGEFA